VIALLQHGVEIDLFPALSLGRALIGQEQGDPLADLLIGHLDGVRELGRIEVVILHSSGWSASTSRSARSIRSSSSCRQLTRSDICRASEPKNLRTEGGRSRS
jgi:hypothetical protein